MSHLYFIPLIAQAITQADPIVALQEAFAEIERQGRLPEYFAGYRQYVRFMREASSQLSELGREVATARWLEDVLSPHADAGVGVDERLRKGFVSSIAEGPATWRFLYGHFAAATCAPPAKPELPAVEVLRNGQSLGVVAASHLPATGELTGIPPGRFELVLNTGWQLWSGELADGDLLLSAAPPGRPLRLAAATGESDDQPTRELTLLGGEIVMNVFAGAGAGRIEIEFRSVGSGQK